MAREGLFVFLRLFKLEMKLKINFTTEMDKKYAD